MARVRVRRARGILAGFVAGCLSGLAYRSYQGDISQARRRVLGGSDMVATRCGPIEHAFTGDGLPVLLVHGAGGGYDQGLEFGKPLATSGFRVISMSRFGYLRTPLPTDASAVAQAGGHVWVGHHQEVISKIAAFLKAS